MSRIDKPTKDNTKIHADRKPITAEVGGQSLTKREEDGVWESLHGTVGEDFAKLLDEMLLEEVAILRKVIAFNEMEAREKADKESKSLDGDA